MHKKILEYFNLITIINTNKQYLTASQKLAAVFFYTLKRNKTMDKFHLTLDGFNMLEQELKNLKFVERPNIIEAIAEARAHGDLSENAEYSAAKEKQSFIEGRIKELEAVTSRAEVIDPKKIACDTVRFGARVNVVDVDTDQEATYQIVGDYEADITLNKISLSSPLAKALMGKEQGDEISYKAPSGLKTFEILDIVY